MTVPDEAVEAAAGKVLESLDQGFTAYQIAYAALDAAAPFLRRDEGGVLDKALQSLREANPDPSVVEALAAKTVKERNNPHTFQSIFTYNSFSRTTVICQLCGMQTVSTYREAGVHPATQHVAWHNQLHRAGIEAA